VTAMDEVVSVGFELVDDDYRKGGNNPESFDYTKLTAVNVCPTWGIIRYGLHKTMPKVYEGSRSMALEAGKAAHDAFAAVRIAQLWRVHPDHARHHVLRIYGKDRGESILAVIRNASSIEQSIRHAGLEALSTSGFVDDPYDRRRTVANLEASVSAYTASYDYDRWPVWVAEGSDPTSAVGIEQPFTVLTTFLKKDGQIVEIRNTGKIDGIHWHREVGGELLVHENKTGGRLDEAWAKSFDISHQVTGYIVAGMLLSGVSITRAVVRGVQLPLPKMIINGLVDQWVTRTDEHRHRWLEWMLHTVDTYYAYKDTPLSAPKYSHSCSRYFRPCPFIPLCYADDSEQKHMLKTEMVVDEWSPLTEEYDG
jgi:hypothetical protein